MSTSAPLERAEIQRHAAAAAGAVPAGPALERPRLRQLAVVLEPPPAVVHYVPIHPARARNPTTGRRARALAVTGAAVAAAVGRQRVRARV